MDRHKAQHVSIRPQHNSPSVRRVQHSGHHAIAIAQGLPQRERSGRGQKVVRLVNDFDRLNGRRRGPVKLRCRASVQQRKAWAQP